MNAFKLMLHSANSQSTLLRHNLWIVTKRIKVWIKVAIFYFLQGCRAQSHKQDEELRTSQGSQE